MLMTTLTTTIMRASLVVALLLACSARAVDVHAQDKTLVRDTTATAAATEPSGGENHKDYGTLAECLSCQYLFLHVFKLNPDKNAACEALTSASQKSMCAGFLRDYGSRLTELSREELADPGPGMCYRLQVCNQGGTDWAAKLLAQPGFHFNGEYSSEIKKEEVAAPPPPPPPPPPPAVLPVDAVSGPRGPTGPRGDPGERGDTGDLGDTGDQGPKGATGAQGDTGPQGAPGGLACSLGENGQLCTGRGECVNGRCKCVGNWGGPICNLEKHFVSCTAVGDPHWTSFDGVYFNEYTNNVEMLEFENPANPVKEAVSAFQCGNGVVAWTCRIGVRRGPHVIRVDIDGAVYINCQRTGVPAETPNGLRVHHVGGMFQIDSPDSGLMVRYAGSEVHIRVFEPRTGGLRGMCGNFNGNPGDDMGNEPPRDRHQPGWGYTAQWIVPAHKSLIDCRIGDQDLNMLGTNVAIRSKTKGTVNERLAAGLKSALWAMDGGDDKVDGRPVLAPPNATKNQAKTAERAVNKETGCTGAALDKATKTCLFLWGKKEFDACVDDVCLTGQSAWAVQDAKAARETDRLKQEGVVLEAVKKAEGVKEQAKAAGA